MLNKIFVFVFVLSSSKGMQFTAVILHHFFPAILRLRKTSLALIFFANKRFARAGFNEWTYG
jgi:hypothetical protein